jgi:hypothetical protein
VLTSIYNCGPLGLQANYARAHAAEIAALASTGHITSLTTSGAPTRQWRLTPKGSFAVTMEFI